MTRNYRSGWISAGRLSASGVFASDQSEARTIARIAACIAGGSRDHPAIISVIAGGSDAGPEGKTAPESAPP